MKKKDRFIHGMGDIDDSILERYDKIDAEIDTKKAAVSGKRKIAVISTVSVAAALVLMITPFALKKLFGLILTSPGESTGNLPPLVSPSESTTEESTPGESITVESTPSATSIDITPETPGILEIGIEQIALGGYFSELFGFAPGEIDLNSGYIEIRTVKDKDYFYAKKAGSFNVFSFVDLPGYECYVAAIIYIVEPGDPDYDDDTKKGEDVTPDPEDIFELKLGDDGDGYTVVSYLGKDAEVVIPEKVNGIYVTHIGREAFKNDENIKSVTLPDSIVSIGYGAFMSCTKLESINLPEGLTEIDNLAFHGCYRLKSINIPRSTEYINDWAFASSGLESITIPDNVTEIGIRAFFNCTSLKSVIIGKGVRKISGGAFMECTSLTNVTISDGVTSIGTQAFMECAALSEIVIPESVTQLDSGIFIQCESLESAVIPGSVNMIPEAMFMNCYKLKLVTLGNGITSIGTYAFSHCISLKNITLPRSLENLWFGSFNSCSLLESINLPEGLERIEDNAFYQCDKLSDVVIPGTVKYIGNSSFYGCSELLKVNIPAGATDIAAQAFGNCPKLRYLIYEGTKEEWEAVRKEEKWNEGSELLAVYTDGELPPTIAISYELGGGTNDIRNPEEVYEYDNIECIYSPTLEGKAFLGWTWDGQEEPIKDPSFTEITEPITLTAVWSFGEGTHAELYEIAKRTPVIDGKFDLEYFSSRVVNLRDYGDEYATGKMYLLWDENALYFYVEIHDVTPQSEYNTEAEDESLDIMLSIAHFDPASDNIPAKRADDIGDAQFKIMRTKDVSGSETLVDNGIKYKDGSHGGFGRWVYENTNQDDPRLGSNYMVHSNDDVGFTAEGFIKWSPELKESVIKEGLIIGVGLQYNDDTDDNGTRDMKCYSENAGPNSMSMSGNRATCGKFILVDSIYVG